MMVNYDKNNPQGGIGTRWRHQLRVQVQPNIIMCIKGAGRHVKLFDRVGKTSAIVASKTIIVILKQFDITMTLTCLLFVVVVLVG